jgi:hypothetical protein
MQLTRINNGYPDYIGKRQAFVGYGFGPTSYLQAASGGDTISVQRYDYYVDYFAPALTSDGTYIVYPFPAVSTAGRQTWALKWVTASTGAEVSSGTNLSGESVILGGFVGSY